MLIEAIPEVPDDFLRQEVKNFILKRLTTDERPEWPFMAITVIWVDGQPKKVLCGSSFQVYDTYLYCDGEPSTNPTLAIASYSAIAGVWKLSDDPEIKDALFTFAAKIIADMVRDANLNRPIVASNNANIVKLALKDNGKAALIDGIWRNPLNGQEVNVDDPSWVIFDMEAY